MNYGEGLITKIFTWITNAANSDGTTQDYAAGLVLIIVASFLWSTVVKMIE